MLRSRLQGVTGYVVTALASAAAAVWSHKLWLADLRVPFTNVGDAVISGFYAKTLRENAWFLHNDRVGAPGILRLEDFPLAESGHMLGLKLLGWLTPGFGAQLNIYYLLGFVLASLAAFACMRRFGVGAPVAVVCSVLYAFLPYHFMRGEHHLFLGAYFSVPPLAGVLLSATMEGRQLFERREVFGRWRPTKEGWVALAICLLTGCFGVYYAFFGCLLLGISGLEAYARHRHPRPLLQSLILAAAIALSVGINVLPSQLYWRSVGKNAEVAQRHPSESEIYAMKISRLFLPIMGHRWKALNLLATKYRGSAPMENEGFETLGMVGVLGFLALLIGAAPKQWPHNPLFERLRVLTFSGIVVGTLGGFGSLIAYGLTPSIRCYNRISIFLAFFALLASALLLDQLWQRIATTPARRALAGGALAALLTVGLLDQVQPGFVPDYPGVAAQFEADRAFVEQVERAVPSGAMIFQLPYVAFPETPPDVRMLPYDHFKPYLHSQTTRWSFGAMKGRETDRWQKEVVVKPPPELLRELARAGFQGLVVDRFGYPDAGAALEQALVAALGAQPTLSPDGRRAFFPVPASLASAAEVLEAARPSPTAAHP